MFSPMNFLSNEIDFLCNMQQVRTFKHKIIQLQTEVM